MSRFWGLWGIWIMDEEAFCYPYWDAQRSLGQTWSKDRALGSDTRDLQIEVVQFLNEDINASP